MINPNKVNEVHSEWEAKHAETLKKLECAKKDIELRDREIAALKYAANRYDRLIESGLICGTCGGSGQVGSPPDDYYDCPDCAKATQKLKADAIRALEEKVHDGQIKVASGSHYLCDWVDAGEWLLSEANKLEAGDDS